MDIPRKIGIMIFCGVPVIVGGGIVYHFTGNYTMMFCYEFLLLLTAGGFVSR